MNATSRFQSRRLRQRSKPSVKLALGCCFAVLAFPHAHINGQEVSVPESTLVSLTGPTIFQVFNYEIAAAALGKEHVIKLEFPQGQLWARVASHLMKVTNGRLPTASDTIVKLLIIKGIQMAGDTLVVDLAEESRQRCREDFWITTGDEFALRAIRRKGRRGEYWDGPTRTPGMFWDAFGCELFRRDTTTFSTSPAPTRPAQSRM